MKTAVAMGAICAILRMPGPDARATRRHPEWFEWWCGCVCGGKVKECFPGERRCTCETGESVKEPEDDHDEGE